MEWTFILEISFFISFQSITEKVIYKESDDHPGKTVALRYAWIDSQVMGFSRAICAVGFERFKKNCNRMVSPDFQDYLIQCRENIKYCINISEYTYYT